MIQIDNVTFRYRKDQKLIEDISINLEKGKIYGLLGKNGAGKSTLLKIMSGLLFPKSGICCIDQKEIKERTKEILAKVFFIPEEFELPSITASKYISINAIFFPRFDFLQLERYMFDFELSMNQNINKMSFGQKKKFIIAFGLATNTEIFILDEPTNGLDIPSKSTFRKIIASAMDTDRLMIISTHQVRDLSQLIDHIIVLDNGNIFFSHSTEVIEEKLTVCKGTLDKTDEILYHEPTLGGYSAICKRNNFGVEMDIELLFNAIINNPTIINNALLTV